MKPEGREIKRTGYMFGTRMYRVRNWFILGSFGFVFLFAAATTKLLYDPESKDILWVQESRKRQEEWRNRQIERSFEVRQRRYRQASKLSEIQPIPIQTEK